MKITNFISKYLSKKRQKKKKEDVKVFDLPAFVEEIYKKFNLEDIWQKHAFINAGVNTVKNFEIKNICYFFAQIAHESDNFRYTKENLRYRADSLLRIFPKYFNKKEAHLLAKNQEAIAHKIYINRMGNKTKEDAWNYIGRGFIQLTGRNNYAAITEDLKTNFLHYPDILETLPCCFYCAGWFWKVNRLDRIKDFKKLTRRINGGYHGLQNRYETLEFVQSINDKIENKIRLAKA